VDVASFLSLRYIQLSSNYKNYTFAINKEVVMKKLTIIMAISLFIIWGNIGWALNKVIITEVHLDENKKVDWVELYAVEDVNLADYTITDMDSDDKDDPFFDGVSTNVSAGQYIVVYFDGTTDGDDTSIEQGSLTNAWEAHDDSTEGQLTLTYHVDQVVLRDGTTNTNHIIDAVCFGNLMTGEIHSNEQTDINNLYSDTYFGSDWVVADTTPNAQRSDCIDVSGSTTAKTFARHPGNGSYVDTQRKSDWYLENNPTQGAANSYDTGDGDYTLPVVLSSFTAIFTDSVVILKWVTESEVDNLGFNIYKSNRKNGPFEKINPSLVKGAGTTAERHGYRYVDDGVNEEEEYYYYIEDISFTGEKDKSDIIRVKWGEVNKLILNELHRNLPQTPDKSLLFQNYPNPFNPETWIPYQIAEESDVVLHIYNVFGKLLVTIDVGHKNSGHYIDRHSAIHWDGRNQNGDMVSSGVYFYQLRAGKYIATRKMLLVK